jgi:hypothetical protein
MKKEWWATEEVSKLDQEPDEKWLREIGFREYERMVGIAIETLPGMYLSWWAKDTLNAFRLERSCIDLPTRLHVYKLLEAMGVDF